MTNLSDRVDAAVQSALADKRIVGAVISVMKDGQLAHRRAYGMADREAGAAMKEDAIFRLASISKPIVTAAAMKMIELKQLSLQAAVTDWLPDFKPKLPDGSAPTITLHHLLSHTSGLSYDFMQPETGPYPRLRVSAGADQPGLTMEEQLRRATEAGLTFPPGAAWLYSIATDVLGAVMAKAAGSTLEQVVEKHVTGPMHMADTAFHVTDKARLVQPYSNIATPPARVEEGFKQPFVPGLAPISTSLARAFDTTSYQAGGSGMLGKADDVNRFLDAIRAGGAPILSETSARTMMSNQIGPLRVMFDPTGSTAFGYGGSILLDPAKSGSLTSPGSWQWGGVWGHSWFVDPVRKITVLNLTNTMLEGMTGQLVRDVQAAAVA
ncbi:MAG TPA: serine hydrolase domain-containing protein [Hyphomonadaceae bacterium]|jgi:CubicO group peptidase (beta-lactamase class C family)|nr:serine hydrolase domain-containing protein [Hyphomonadaceae bacterium]